MTSVLGYARTFFEGGRYWPEPMPDLDAEVTRFHSMLEDLARHLMAGTELNGTTEDRLLQGPFADAMTHAGQLAILRRLSGSPVPQENFVVAAVHPANLGPDLLRSREPRYRLVHRRLADRVRFPPRSLRGRN